MDRLSVWRLLLPARLAPGIIEAIVRGEEGRGVAVERLLKGLPVL